MGYPIKKLGEIANYINGKAFKPTDWGIKGLPIIRIQNLNGKNEYNYFDGYIEDKYLINNGDILISWSASLDVYIWDGGKAVLNQHIFKVDIDDNIVNKQFFYYLIKNSLAEIIHNTHGVGMKHITKGNFEKIKTIFPPLPTQKLIVQKLDSSFEQIDKSIELTKKNLKNIEELNKSVLEEVFREGEYEMKIIDEISENVQYGYTGKTTEKGKVKYLRITDIQDNNIIWNNVPFVDIEEKEIPKYSLNEGDIVFARTGATVGKSCLIDSNGVGNIFASYLIRIVGKKEIINPNFMQYFFYSKNYWEQIGFDVVGAAQPNFNGTKLKQIQLPLPPLLKQKEIVAQLDQVFEKNKALKESYEKKLKDLEEMKQSLLKEAFEGRLVKE